jgi:glutamyl-tRNA synthetase
MGVTEIVRGRDLLLSSPQQIHLRELLFGERKTENGKLIRSALPVNFFHHPLICNAECQRLCKRDKSMDLGYLRDKGTTSQDIIALLAHLAGMTDTIAPITPQELIPLFSWDKVPLEDIILENRTTL